MKKLLSTIMLSSIGLSFVCANESAIISTIKNNNVYNVRKVGYELCKLYIKKNKIDAENSKEVIQDDFWSNLWNKKFEEKIAKELMKDDNSLKSEIFCGRESDDKVIQKLQHGCFDFLAEEISFHFKNFFEETYLIEKEDIENTLEDFVAELTEPISVDLSSIDFSSIDEILEKGNVINSSDINDEVVEEEENEEESFDDLDEDHKNAYKKLWDAITVPQELIESLGLTDRLQALKETIMLDSTLTVNVDL